MKKFTMLLFGTIFIALIISSIKPTSADHLEDASGVFRSMDEGNIAVATIDSEYQIHLQTVIRNGDDYLINVNESTSTAFIPHQITDDVFDTMLGEKEIVTVDGIKYEKIQFTQRFQSQVPPNHGPGTAGVWLIEACGGIVNEHLGIECANIFEMRTNQMVLEDDDVVETQWTILRTMN